LSITKQLLILRPVYDDGIFFSIISLVMNFLGESLQRLCVFCQLQSLVLRPDVLRGGGEKNVWSLSHTFCDSLECNYITSQPSTFADNMACLLCLLVLRSDQRQRVSTTSLRPVCEELLKLCHENCVVSEAFTRPDAFLCRQALCEKSRSCCALGKGTGGKEGYP